MLCECGNAYTASMSRSGTGKLHAYYRCQNKICDHEGKSIRRDEIEGAFEDILKQIVPSRDLVKVADKMFERLWEQRAKSQRTRTALLRNEINEVGKKIEKLLDRIVDSDNPRVIEGLEKRVTELGEQKLILEEKLEKSGEPIRPYRDMYRTAMQFVSKPHEIWASGGYLEKMAVRKLVLSGGITYVRNKGYRTVDFSLPFKVLGGFVGQKDVMVARDRIELSTRGFSVPCSTN